MHDPRLARKPRFKARRNAGYLLRDRRLQLGAEDRASNQDGPPAVDNARENKRWRVVVGTQNRAHMAGNVVVLEKHGSKRRNPVHQSKIVRDAGSVEGGVGCLPCGPWLAVHGESFRREGVVVSFTGR